MQGKWDPRASFSGLRPEHMGGNYLDLLVDTAADFYEPYADLFALMSPGNHETAITKRHEVNLTYGLTRELNRRADANVQLGSYAGYVVFRLRVKSKNTRGDACKTFIMYRTHGYGGGGPVTKDVIQTNRHAAVQADAKVIWSGHVHQQWYVEHERMRCTTKGRVYTILMTLIRVS